jgi:hypothetical protein
MQQDTQHAKYTGARAFSKKIGRRSPTVSKTSTINRNSLSVYPLSRPSHKDTCIRCCATSQQHTALVTTVDMLDHMLAEKKKNTMCSKKKGAMKTLPLDSCIRDLHCVYSSKLSRHPLRTWRFFFLSFWTPCKKKKKRHRKRTTVWSLCPRMCFFCPPVLGVSVYPSIQADFVPLCATSSSARARHKSTQACFSSDVFE